MRILADDHEQAVGGSGTARMERVVGFYEKLPRGPAPEFKPKGPFEWYQARYFGKESSAARMSSVHSIA